jgi:hypothetical protein
MVRIGRALSTNIVHRRALQRGNHVGPNGDHPEKQRQRRKSGGFFHDSTNHDGLPCFENKTGTSFPIRSLKSREVQIAFGSLVNRERDRPFLRGLGSPGQARGGFAGFGAQ